MLPRTAADALECALVGREMLDRRVEPAEALTDCLDVLAQHCVSIAAGGEMTVEALLHLVRGAWGYRALREEELIDVLRMLSGAFAHAQGKPARPRLFYDAVQGRVSGDAYSRMLACSGSTIPDRGMFPVYLEDGTTRLGELDEEFVFEARVGDRFMLGAFPWQMTRIGRDRVIVRAVGRAGAQVPFWRGEEMGRPYALGVRIGAWMRRLEEGLDAGEGAAFLMRLLPMDARTALQVHAMLREQREQVGVLPTDRRMLVEHFRGDAGNDCMMVHSPFGGRVHQGLGILLSDALHQAIGGEVLAYHADDGVLCISIGTATLPDDALSLLSPDCIEDALMRLLPGTALFAMVYRYAAMRALMLGMGRRGVRQPLWAQRQRGAASLEEAMKSRDHPLLLEAARECIHQQI
ncbi:MAG: DEAD/DEAH box helicase, partial [Clostridia bacterium]